MARKTAPKSQALAEHNERPQPKWPYFAEALAWYPPHTNLTGAQVFGVVQQVRAALRDGRITSEDLGLDESMIVGNRLRNWGRRIVREIDRLWPQEADPAYRAACLAEEAGEVNRSVTKRRHAEHAPDGRCKGLTVDEWTEELALELAQTVGVILDIAHREGIDLVVGVERCVAILEQRKAGS